MNQDIKEYSLEVIVNKISELIKKNKGDLGRLKFIVESLETGKKLYNSDKLYLEKKLQTKIKFSQTLEQSKDVNIIDSVKTLIQRGIGDAGRLRFILSSLIKKRPLYNTDKNYLNEKLTSLGKLYEQKQKFQYEPTSVIHPAPRLITASQKEIEPIDNLKSELEKYKKTIQNLEKIIQEQKKEIVKLKEKLIVQKKSLPVNETIYELLDKISNENRKISEQEKIKEVVKEQRIRLNQLISYREEYERKINKEKNLLEKQMRAESIKIAEKDKLVKELARQEQEIERLKTEKSIVLEQVKQEKARITPEIMKLKMDLDEANRGYEELVIKFTKEKEELERKIKEQKEKNKNKKDEGKGNSGSSNNN